ncbi:zinc ribbon domain-containing protein [Klebsiella aerogenes]
MTNQANDMLGDVIEQRADFIPSEDLKNETSANDYFNRIIESLLSRKLTLIEGPRGCGKTHAMRYTALTCFDDESKPFAIYVSFNRYYRLEPLLTSNINAIGLFHSWMLAQLIVEALDTLKKLRPDLKKEEINTALNYIDTDILNRLIIQLERNGEMSAEESAVERELSVSNVKNILENIRILSNRKRIVLLLDDAALTLTPEYMKEFFDIFKNLKSSLVSPKASVYPGTTEYGARFHPTQEGDVLPVWLSVEDLSYSEVMDEIAKKRVANFDTIPKDVNEYLKMASFGIPRAYLLMLQEFQLGGFRTLQQGLNRLIQHHVEDRIKEFNSITHKSPKLKNIVEAGNTVFNDICILLKNENDNLKSKEEKQLRIGISGVKENTYVERMFNLLVEAGLLYEVPETVSHGEERDYIRYIPHISALLHQKAFTSGERGFSVKNVIEHLKFPSKKHPVRRSVSTLIKKEVLDKLTFDLPPCGSCGAVRIGQTQKFCHNCGAELISLSTFEQCMRLPLHEVPGLTTWQMNKIKNEIPKFKSIGDFLSSQDPSKELRKAERIGFARAEKIIRLVQGFVDEFLQ